MSEKRETLGSRLGFIFLSAGCAIGLGNVWRFPYITGRYGGAAFIILYLLFLLIFGLPVMVMEFSVGRASKKSVIQAFDELEPKGSKWHIYGAVATLGNYILMIYYTVLAGWMLNYFVASLRGALNGLSQEQIGGFFNNMLASPATLLTWMFVVIIVGFFICAMGLQGGVEKVAKFMMSGLLFIVIVLAVRVAFLPNVGPGYEFYLKPDFGKMVEHGLGEAVYAALGQAFFTLSIGMGSLTIFGSYIDKSQSLQGEAVSVVALDTFVAILAGLIIFPAAFSFGIEANSGPGLIFVTLPNIFTSMTGGQLWQTLFFLFMCFAAMTTVIAVFENLVACLCDKFKISRIKSVIINFVVVSLLSVPCALGFNVWSDFQPLGPGTGVLDLEDFIVSNNILPLGSMVFLFFCTTRWGWGWEKFIEEANTGKGRKFPSGKGFKFYLNVILPIIILVVFVMGYVQMFGK